MKLGISLFSSGGIGDLAMRANNVHMLVANELLSDRAALFSANYPDTHMIVGDINQNIDNIISETNKCLQGRKLDVIFATPPCQGMSKNGRGKLLSEVRLGNRENFDPRNQLIVPTIKIIKYFKPEFIFFENVPEMENTYIIYENKEIKILDFIKKSLPEYVGYWKTIEFANYGVPQRRQRLITIFTKNKNVINYIRKYNTCIPKETHSESCAIGTKPWITVRDAIQNLPPLDAKNKKLAVSPSIPFHRVPILDEDKYFWVENTPEGKSAFDNQCPFCHYTGNKIHGTSKKLGINQSNKDTPIYCSKCGRLLPRPWVKKDGEYRIMHGYTSAYKRMSWDMPAPALTRNFSYACSDNKLHPIQNRVLSLYEAFILHTINCYEYKWVRNDGKKISDKTIRDVIGESIPPKGLEYIVEYIFNIADNKIKNNVNLIKDQIQLKL